MMPWRAHIIERLALKPVNPSVYRIIVVQSKAFTDESSCFQSIPENLVPEMKSNKLESGFRLLRPAAGSPVDCACSGAGSGALAALFVGGSPEGDGDMQTVRQKSR